MVAAPGMLVNAGKKEDEGCVCCPCCTCAIYMLLLPAQSIWLAQRKGLQLVSSFLYYLRLSYLDRPSMVAEVERFVRFVFLFLALFCQAFCFCFLGH